MIRTKLGLLGLCAVGLGMMAISASSAQGAFSWLILDKNGQNLENLQAKLEGANDSIHYTLSTHALSTTLNITCNNFELIGMEILLGGVLNTGGKARFTGCEAYKTAPLTEAYDCMVHSPGQPKGTVVTNRLKGKLVLHTIKAGETEVLTQIESAEEGEEAGALVKLEFELCAFSSSKLKGVLLVKDCNKAATTHAVLHLVEQGPLTSLVYGSDTVEHLSTSLIGSGWIKLGGPHEGLSWAAMDA